MSKSHENGSNEQVYFCTIPDEFEDEASEFFTMEDNETIDLDVIVDCLDFEGMPFPFNRALQAF